MSELRKFGISLGLALGLLGLWLAWNGKGGQILLFFSAFFVFFGIFMPQWLRPLYRLSILLGNLMTAIVLTVFYYLLFTPAALLIRLFKKNFFDIKMRRKQPTYWIPKGNQETVYERPY